MSSPRIATFPRRRRTRFYLLALAIVTFCYFAYRPLDADRIFRQPAVEILNHHIYHTHSSSSSSSSSSPIEDGTCANPTSKACVNGVRRLWSWWGPRMAAARPRAGTVGQVKDYPNAAVWLNEFGPRKVPQDITNSTVDEVESLRQSHTFMLEALQHDTLQDAATKLYAGTGIVMVAGGKYFSAALVTLHMLRRTGSNLPVELFVKDQAEYDAHICEKLLPSLNARCLVLADFFAPYEGPVGRPDEWLQEQVNKTSRNLETASFTSDLNGFQMKAPALLFSSFRHALLLDADCLPLVAPESSLFTTEQYDQYGFIDWPDAWLSSESLKFYYIANVSDFPPNLPKTTGESGQLLMDKHRHFHTLLLSLYYNLFGPRTFYPLQNQGAIGEGDKTTFSFAAIVLNAPWYRVATLSKVIGRHSDAEFLGTGMIQFHPAHETPEYLAHNRTNLFDNMAPDQRSLVRPAFLHSMNVKLDAGRLVAERDALRSPSGRRLRLWDSKHFLVEMVGKDLEKEAFEVVIDVTKQVGSSLPCCRGEKDKERLLAGLREHYKAVFTEGSEMGRGRGKSGELT